MKPRNEALIAAIVIIGVLFSVGLMLNNAGKTTSTSTTVATALSTTTTSATVSTSTLKPVRTTIRTTTRATTTSTTTTYPVAIDTRVSMTLSSDKSLYHSNDMLNLTLQVQTQQALSSARLKVYGIMSGYYRVDETKVKNLTAGYNLLQLGYKTPRCYGCSGIRPGFYNVTVDLIYDGRVIATSSTRIEMQQ